jgi:hypothetical protein
MVIFSSVAGACAKAVTVEQYPDLDRRVTRMSGNEIKIDQSMSNDLILNAAKVEESGGSRYVLWVQLRGSAAVRPQSLTLRVDGDLWTISELETLDAQMACPERTTAERSLGISEAFGCVYLELYWAPITASQLERLASARRVTVRLDGVGGHVERQFSPENLANFAEFVAQHVPSETVPTTPATPE